MHLIGSTGTVITGIVVCIGVLASHPLWQWFSHCRDRPTQPDAYALLRDAFDQDDDRPSSNGVQR